MLRFHVLSFILNATRKQPDELMSAKKVFLTFSYYGCTREKTIECLELLAQNSMIRCKTGDSITEDSEILITRVGAYCVSVLCKEFVYCESCLIDTTIEDGRTWADLLDKTSRIESKQDGYLGTLGNRMNRIKVFLSYLCDIEKQAMGEIHETLFAVTMEDVRRSVIDQVQGIYKSQIAKEAKNRQRNNQRIKGY